MFAVPGWSISADTLKAQTEPKTSKAATERKPHLPNYTVEKKSRKRKRGLGSGNAVEVTEENLGDLWRKYIEEKSLGQPGPKKEGKKSKQSNEEKDDAWETIEDVHGDGFEGFSEEENLAGTTEEEASRKRKKRKVKEDKPAGLVQANGHEDAAEASPPLLNEEGEVENGKSKYERRKAKALKKREERALLQANGTLPPIRVEAVSSYPTETAPRNSIQTVKRSESSRAPDTLQEHTLTHSTRLPKGPNPPRPSTGPHTTETKAPSLPSSNLTPLQQRMAAKLTSARFRYLNQTLYTSPSDQAMRLFNDSPQNYVSYHAGFRAQVAVWPQNPVEGFIEDIQTRSKVLMPSQKKLWREQKVGKKPKGSVGDATAGATTIQEGEKVDPLPRSRNGVCEIVDLGCGDATLAGSLHPCAKSLSLKLLSFDLAKGDTPNAHLITVADISKLSAAGVKDATVDIAICCLSLMGTNWVDVVGECARIVRGGGEVWVAEIKSRFARPEAKKEAGGGIGRKKSTDKGKNADGEEDDEAITLEELEDAKIKGGKDETDVSAFVEVFRKRGLILKGEPDIANKMFVRMRFAKLLGARGEKGVDERNTQERNGSMGKHKMYAKTKFVDEETEEMDENLVLKPCVYKTR
ncbi:MAG: 25S rRNA (adenine645-N1)-methyltransferase [Alectoria fallacina]|uniref:Ribosomal RNA-processing protein 8 n=1 Tax=Alectoria fallacina TaxID=1903189 RepID=A0A8H3F507_9LECA|nr:MAG: 25S rRNA (adenine645-N1)-methyltransferase [Alectoria fallacina]